MTIRDYRDTYRPFEYPKFVNEDWQDFQESHWNSNGKAPITSESVNEWKEMPLLEQEIIGGVLKVFTLVEFPIGEYWASKIPKWFPKHEIIMLARWLGGNETVHVEAYDKINDVLQIDNYAEFLEDPAARDKLEYLMAVPEDDPDNLNHHIARSIAIFSAFAEGVSLFSSFAMLYFFSLCGVLKEVGKIVEYSCLDENKHSEIGIELFNIFVDEFPELRTPKLQADIEEAARQVERLESHFIDSVFEKGEIERVGPRGERLTKDSLKQYIKLRINNKLVALGYKPIFEVDLAAANSIAEWFDLMTSAIHKQDFFANKEHNYGVVSNCTAASFFGD